MIKSVIVDDEPAVEGIITYFIQNKGLPIINQAVAVDGGQAVELIQLYKPDIVYLDIQMPVMNGFEVMQSVPGPKYIIITAHGSFEYAQQALRMGASDIILKPIEYKQLYDATTNAIGWAFTDNIKINSILECIHKSYAQRLYLTQLSDSVFSDASHIARLFKKYLGMSVIAYVHKVRIDKAIDLLKTQQLSIKEIADQVGYDSLNNFYKYFKAYTGHPPAAYRKSEH